MEYSILGLFVRKWTVGMKQDQYFYILSKNIKQSAGNLVLSNNDVSNKVTIQNM